MPPPAELATLLGPSTQATASTSTFGFNKLPLAAGDRARVRAFVLRHS
jgi:hypothetical protein